MKKIIILIIFFFHYAHPQSEFKFAWLSDIHIGYPTAEQDLRLSVNDINSNPDIEFTIISGDITAIGSLGELSLAKMILDELEKPYYIIPGNHDCKWSESGATDFLKLWGNDRFVFEKNSFLFIGLHQGPRMRMADGFWAPEDLRWLDSVLASLQDSNQPIFFITHYPLDKSIANWYEVLDRLKNFNTQAALFGHGHRNRVYDFEGIPGIMGRSNLRANNEKGGYTISSVNNDSMTFSEKIPGKDPQFWYSLPIVQRNYEAYLTEAERPDYSINKKYPFVKEVWSFNSGFTIGSSAAIFEDKIIAADASGKIYSLNISNGNPEWTFQTNGPIYSTPAVERNSIVFGSCDSMIYCLDAQNGKQKWSLKTRAAVLGSPVIDNNIVYIGGSDSFFRAIDISDGRLIWSSNVAQGFIETRPVIHEEKVFFGAWDEHFYCLDKNTGDLIWKWKGEKNGKLLSPAACWPVVSKDKVFFAMPDRTLNALDIYSGQTLMRSGQFEVRESVGLSDDGEILFARTMNDTLLAIRTCEKFEDPLWITDAGFGYDISSAQIVEKDDRIFYPTKTGELYCLNAKTGEILWIYKLSSGFINTVTPVNSNLLVTTGFDGLIKLISFRPEK